MLLQFTTEVFIKFISKKSFRRQKAQYPWINVHERIKKDM